MPTLGKIFIKGLAAMIPLAVTIWAVVWLIVTAESLLGEPIGQFLPEGMYVRGMGVIAGLITVFFVGLLLNFFIIRAIFHQLEALLNKLPLIKSVYGAVKDLLSFFMNENQKGQQVVLVTLWPEHLSPVTTPAQPPQHPTTPTDTTTSTTTSTTTASDIATTDTPPSPTRQPMKLLGLVTRTTFNDLPQGMGNDQSVAVYLPMSYQIGGFTVIVNKSQIEPISMSTEDALRFAITAGMNAQPPQSSPASQPPAPPSP